MEPDRHRPPAPRRFSVLAGMGAVVLACAAMLAVTGRAPPQVIGAVIVLGALPLIAGIVGGVSASERRRKTSLREECEAMGLEHTVAKQLPDRKAWFAPFEHVKVLRTGAKGLVWIADSPPGADPLVLFEHFYIVSTGNSVARIVHTVAAKPCPPSWPALTLTPRHLGHRIAALFERRDVQLESAEFNRRWFVRCDDEDFAILLLGPEMQTWLLETARRAVFVIGEGRLACLERKAPKRGRLARLTGLVEGFLARVPPELEAYAAEA